MKGPWVAKAYPLLSPEPPQKKETTAKNTVENDQYKYMSTYIYIYMHIYLFIHDNKSGAQTRYPKGTKCKCTGQNSFSCDFNAPRLICFSHGKP